MKIATLGPEGTFSHQAVLKYDKKAEIVFKDTIWDVFDSVMKGEVDKGIVPIENSVSGTVGLTLDALMDFELKICAELIIPIKHNLAGRGKIKDIKYVYSNLQTFAQCEKFIRNRMNKVEIIPAVSNAKSAERLSKNKGEEYAAIVPGLAMKKYGLTYIAKDIQDSKFNATRFIVLNEKSTKRKGNDRTSIAIYPHMDKPGLLYTLIGSFLHIFF